MSCPTSSFCVAADWTGNALTYNGTSWSPPTKIDANNYLTSVSCPTSDFCAAVDGVGNALTYTAPTTLPPRTLTVSLAGSGAGTVTASGGNCPGACSHSYANGTIVTLIATPKAGSTFAGWSASGCSGTGTCAMTMSADQTVTATFTATIGSHTAPAIGAFKLTNTRFMLGAQATAINAKAKAKIPRGSTFLYTLSQAGKATIVIVRQTPGRLVGKKYVVQTKSNAKKKRCTIITRVGMLTRNSKAGSSTVAFSGRIGRTALRPASYQATITARAGNGPTSKPRSATFTIIRG